MREMNFRVFLVFVLLISVPACSDNQIQDDFCHQGVVIDGICYPFDCDQQDCPEGSLCKDNNCIETECLVVECGPRHHCEAGLCVPDDCSGENTGEAVWLFDTRSPEDDTYYTSAIEYQDPNDPNRQVMETGGRDTEFLWEVGCLKYQPVNIATWPQSNDGVIIIREGSCTGDEIRATDCNGYFSGCGHARVSGFVPTADRYCIILDSFNGTATGGGGIVRLGIYAESNEENCTNGIDDNADGDTDCSDWRCYINTQCSTMSSCEGVSTALRNYEGNIWGYDGMNWRETNDFEPSCGTPGGQEGVLQWIAPNNGRFRIETQGSNYDTILWVRRGTCMGEEVACNNDTVSDDQTHLWSTVEFDAVKGEVFIVGVDTNGPNTPGSNVEVQAHLLF
jgi:hypothetical protein